MENVQNAVNEYINRQERITHPIGVFDNGGRWYPGEDEEQACCKSIRHPSRAYPYSKMNHCRTITHVANLFGVTVKDIRQNLPNKGGNYESL